MIKPKIEWHEFLSAAPNFTALLTDDIDMTQLAPLLRAAAYFDIFDGEICNGSVAQYFFNKADSLPGFAQAAQYIAANPIFGPVMHIVNEVHAAWDSCAQNVAAARDDADWPEELFEKYHSRFDALQTEFYQLNHAVRNQFSYAVLRTPQDYFELAPIEGVSVTGVSHIAIHQNSKRLRFKDGFPVGPNVFEKRDGSCLTVRFSDERDVMERVDAVQHYWVHYPSGRTIDMSFNDKKLDRLSTGLNHFANDGLYDWFHPSGHLRISSRYQQSQELACTRYYLDGSICRTSFFERQGKVETGLWPNGRVNIRCVEDKNGGLRVIECFAENGDNLAPDGNGQYLEIISEQDDHRTWTQGALIKGRLTGEIKRFEKNLKTGVTKQLT